MNILSSKPVFSDFVIHSDFDLDKIKKYCKIESGEFEDDIILDMLEDSVDTAQKQSGLVFGSATITAYYDKLNEKCLNLLYSPVVSVDRIEGIMESGDINLLSDTEYNLTTGNSGFVELKSGSLWPETDKTKSGYRIVYNCSLDCVPKSVLAGCNIDIFSMYHDRERVRTPSRAIARWQSAKVKVF